MLMFPESWSVLTLPNGVCIINPNGSIQVETDCTRFHVRDVKSASSCIFLRSAVECDGVTNRFERVRSLRHVRASSTHGYVKLGFTLRLCCSFRHMSHHRSFLLRQDGGAPATTTKSLTRRMLSDHHTHSRRDLFWITHPFFACIT